MIITLGQAAKLVNGAFCGDEALEINGAATLRDARPGQITLADDEKLASALKDCCASAVLVAPDFPTPEISHIVVDNVHAAFIKLITHFHPPRVKPRVGISPQAYVHPTAQLGENVDVHPGASIGRDAVVGAGSTIHSGAQIGDGCRLGEYVVVFPNATLYEDTIVGDRSILHAGAVIGAYGFGYETREGRHHLSAQLGYVEIGADVEVGACTTIDRGTYGPTVIGEGTKIDNQVMIAHNCRIGRHNILCSQVGIAGSCTTGDYVVMAGQVGIGDHIQIGHQATLGAKAGIMHDIPDGEAFVGIPATPVRDQMVKQAAFAKLPQMRKQLKQLEQAIQRLAQQAGEDDSQNHSDAA